MTSRRRILAWTCLLGALLALLGYLSYKDRSPAVVFGIADSLSDRDERTVEARTNTCPVCGRTSVFQATGRPARPRAKCPVCGSLERHRLLFLYLRDKTDLFRAPLSVLHFSPEPGLQAVLSAQPNLRYATSWYEPDRPADFHLDLTRLTLPDDSWDVMICYHVFEHIPDDRAAMREMFRTLKPGGWAVVQVPVRANPETLEDPGVDTDAERLALYGKEDHVRYYGWKDFADRLETAGFAVTIEQPGLSLPAADIERHALHPNERIYVLRKPARTVHAPATTGVGGGGA